MLEKLLAGANPPADGAHHTAPPNLGLMASTVPMAAPSPSPKSSPPLPQPNGDTAPLQLRVGNTSIMPVGFMDATAYWRDKDAGGVIGSNFGSVPFNNVPAAKLSEFRFSPQNSRLGFRVDGNFKGAHF